MDEVFYHSLEAKEFRRNHITHASGCICYARGVQHKSHPRLRTVHRKFKFPKHISIVLLMVPATCASMEIFTTARLVAENITLPQIRRRLRRMHMQPTSRNTKYGIIASPGCFGRLPVNALEVVCLCSCDYMKDLRLMSHLPL